MAATLTVSTKATFTFDEATVRRLAEASVRLARPKSEIVREAIHEFHSRLDRLSDGERETMLRAFDELIPAIPERAAAEIDKELRNIRRARRAASVRGQTR